MANKKITDLPELAEAPNANDLFEIVDVSTGTSKRIKAQYLGGGTTPTLDEVLAVGNTANLKDVILVTDGLDDLGNFIAELEASNVKTRQTYQSFEVLDEYGLTSLISNRLLRNDELGNSTTVVFTSPTGNGMIYIPDVINSTETLSLLSDIPTNTSDLINDGDDGNPFISLLDLPSNIIFYPTNVASDIVGYVKIVTSITDPSYNTTAVDVTTGAITTTNQLISSLATAPNIIVGNPGVFNITTIGNIRRTSGSGTASFYFQVYKRTSGGTETLIATSANTIPILDSGTYVEFSATAIWDDGIFLDTDRVVMKYYANRIAGGSNPTYEFQFGGIAPVRTLVPIPLSVVPVIVNATETVAGIAEIATTAEVTTGTDDTRIVTPLKLKQVTDNYMQVILNCNVLGSTVSGGTNIVLYQINVPANTFSDLDAFEIEALGAKVGTTAVSTIRLWTDTASTFNSGTAQLLAVSSSLGATNLFQTIKREFHVRGTTVKCLANTVGIGTDEATSTLAANSWASYTFNPAVANTLYFTATGNAADTFTKQNYKITRYKNKSTI
jgi:hypothetical protein